MNRNARRGGAAIEFALTTMLLITMVFGLFDYGWYFWQHSQAGTVLVKAMRSGGLQPQTDAEKAARAGDCAQCVSVAQSAALTGLTGLGLNVVAADVTPVIASYNGACTLRMIVDIEHQPLVAFVPTPRLLHFEVVELAQGVLQCP